MNVGLSKVVAALSSLAVMASLATHTAAGGGNITTNVDEAGDLWLYGDELGNELRLLRASDEADDEFFLQGLNGTTIDGQPHVVLVATGTRIVMILGGGDNAAVLGTEKPTRCRRDLIVIAGPGDDNLLFSGPFPFSNIDLGPGNDHVTLVEGGSGLRGNVYMRDGDDVISIGEFTGLTADVDMGNGNDRLFIGHGSGAHGNVDMGFGDDEIELDRATGFEGEIQMGPGNDRFHGDTDDGPSNLLTWTGNDVVDLETGGDASILTGRDDDTVTVTRLLEGSLLVDTEHGSDRVHVAGIGLPLGSGPIDSLT